MEWFWIKPGGNLSPDPCRVIIDASLAWGVNAVLLRTQ